MVFVLCAQALQRLAVASGKLRDLLGPYLHSLVSQLLAEGLHLGQAIMPALVHAIAIGPSSAASGNQTISHALKWARYHDIDGDAPLC